MNKEKLRIRASVDEKSWKKWGPYLAERQWGTVREDYSNHGTSWDFITHDLARSNAFRWGEEGIAGFCDAREILCLAPAFWNGNDPILKERLFGLTNDQGNHGEDVKELYFHLDSSPTHSYCKYLYKYPHQTFPYDDLVKKNQIGLDQLEFELLDTGIFSDDRYFDCYIEYAKAGIDDILMQVTVFNRGPEAHEITVVPQIWFRNFWKHNPRYERPVIKQIEEGTLQSKCIRNGRYQVYYQSNGTALFCENETNNEKIYQIPNDTSYVKDGINEYVVNGLATVNPKLQGSKVGIMYKAVVEANGSEVFKIRLSKRQKNDPWKDFDEIVSRRREEANAFYHELTPSHCSIDQRHLLRSALGGLQWTKQFYYLDVFKWLHGGPGEVPPDRALKRNSSWEHLTNRDIISMPDKWEYPWYAAWDLAFHTVTFAEVDPHFAKHQLKLMLTELYMHPNGQIPAYEWNFSDVNPPVHSWAVWEVFEKDKIFHGQPDHQFLEICFQKLLINFTWWVNQKDNDGNDLFEGGFLGLDNIGVFDRNHMPPGIANMQQADATSWMANFCLHMMKISMELASQNKAYEESAVKFFRHFLNIGFSMHNISSQQVSLWDNEDAFYYDVVQMENGYTARMKVRSLVGLLPLIGVDVIHKDVIDELKEFKERAHRIIRTRPDLASLISRIEEANKDGYYLFSIVRAYRLESVLKRMLDEDEFLSPFGIRSLSKYHEKHPFVFHHHGKYSINYVPGESQTGMFGGNSNWRGPIWFPVNYLIIQSLRKFYKFYGPDYVYEFPTRSGNKLNLNQIANELSKRLLKLFEKDEQGKYHYHNDDVGHKFTQDEHFKNHHLFYEFFHGETGRGMGASHQTGWTALVANLILEMEEG